MRAWGKLDGQQATEYALSHSGEKSDAAVAALGGWSSIDPQRARAWIDAQPEGKAKEALIYGLLDGWSMFDFQSAAAYAESRPHSEERDSFRELLLQRALRAGGTEAAQQWFNNIAGDEKNRDYKTRAFGEVVQAMLYRDPAAAARWVSEMNGQPFVSISTVNQTAEKLAENFSRRSAELDWFDSGVNGWKVVSKQCRGNFGELGAPGQLRRRHVAGTARGSPKLRFYGSILREKHSADES